MLCGIRIEIDSTGLDKVVDELLFNIILRLPLKAQISVSGSQSINLLQLIQKEPYFNYK